MKKVELGKVRRNRIWEMGEVDFFVVSRWILILLVLFLIGYNTARFEYMAVAYRIAVIYVIFNFIIRFRIFKFLEEEKFMFLLFLFDIGFVSVALYLSKGIEQNFFIVYLLTVVMAAMSSGLRSSFPVAILSAVLYVWIGYTTGVIKQFNDPAYLLRLPFLFLIAFMSGAWADMMRKKIEKKEKMMREEILKLKNFYERIINSVNVGIIVINTQGGVMLENPEMKKMFDKGIIKEELLKKIMEGKRGNVLLRENERFIDAVISSSRKEDLIIGIVRDITDLKRMEEELEHSRRLADIGKMASYIAHEVRNPLGVIRGMTQLIKMKFNGEVLNDYTEKVLKSVEMIDRIIEDTLDFARKKPLDIEKVNLGELIREIVESVPIKKKVSSKNARVIFDDTGECDINGDRMRLVRVFENLILNGLDAISEGGYVRISFNRDESNVYVNISDNGCGIDEKDINRIFEPFYTSKKHGTGLGLSIVKKIVDNHGGRISVKSKRGKGTVFTVQLPLSKKVKDKEVCYEGVNR